MPFTTDPALKLILADIDPKWHVDFVRFVQTGKACQDFLNVLDADASLQNAVERACFADEGNIREPYQEIVKSKLNVAREALSRIVEAGYDEDCPCGKGHECGAIAVEALAMLARGEEG